MTHTKTEMRLLLLLNCIEEHCDEHNVAPKVKLGILEMISDWLVDENAEKFGELHAEIVCEQF